MGKDSGIEWTDHTFNPWWGCEKVSPACDLCYAETFAKRTGNAVWGKDAPRRFFGDKHWNEPLKWDAMATKAKTRAKVFCASMADVFEDRADLEPQRQRLWKLIEKTSSRDWLLLTKRPENIGKMAPWGYNGPWPFNVWMGVTAENQRRLDERMKYLGAIPAALRWISYEPALGALSLVEWHLLVDWVIIGGESGAGHRPMKQEWATDLIKECRELDVVPFMKQLGGFPDKRHDINEFPEGLRVREFPRVA